MKEVAVNALTLKVTKRNGFFVLPSIFDPIGLLQPFYCYLESNFTKNLFNKNRLGLKIPENLSKHWQNILRDKSTLPKIAAIFPYFEHPANEPTVFTELMHFLVLVRKRMVYVYI